MSTFYFTIQGRLEAESKEEANEHIWEFMKNQVERFEITQMEEE